MSVRWSIPPEGTNGLVITAGGAKHNIKSILIGKHSYKRQHLLLQQIISGWDAVDTKGPATFLFVTSTAIS